MGHDLIVRCPKCIPPAVRRADGRRIVGWMPESLYVGYLKVNRSFGVTRPPVSCPNCQTSLIERPVTDAAS